MPTPLTWERAAVWLGHVSEALDRRVRRAESETLRDLRKAVRFLSSGTLTPRDLRRLDHPFARRHGRPLLPPYRVNRQSGAFLLGWRTSEPAEEDGSVVSRLWNADPKAELVIEGSDTTFGRPVAEKALEMVQEQREARLTVALAESFRP